MGSFHRWAATLATVACTTLSASVTKAAVSDAPLDSEVLRKYLVMNWVRSNQFEIATHPELHSVWLTGDERPWTGSFLPSILGYAAANYEPIQVIRNGLKSAKHTAWIYEAFRFPFLTSHADKFGERDLEHMAPAEKYDLILGTLGDKSSSLTAKMFEQALETDQENGTAFWTGFCHGWAPASIAVPRPLHGITVPSRDGKYQVPLFPSDLKALATTLFANSMLGTENAHRTVKHDNGTEEDVFNPDLWTQNPSYPIHFQRCNKRIPKRDSAGRPIDPACRDSDPAFFHLMAINLVGGTHRGFVVEKKNNAAVDNMPVTGYTLHYFNPKSGKLGSFESSMIDVANFKDDQFKEFRTPGTRYIVGVKMNLRIVNYTSGQALVKETNAETEMREKTTEDELHYDLELAADGTILGGEWKSGRNNMPAPLFGIRPRAKYPDFMWHVPYGLRAYSVANEEFSNEQYDPSHPISDSLRNGAIQAIRFKKEFSNRPEFPGYNKNAPSPVDIDLAPQPMGKLLYKWIEESRK